MSLDETPSFVTENASLNVHRGATDPTVITNWAPQQVMQKMDALLEDMRIQVTKKTAFLYRCTTLKKEVCSEDDEQTENGADEVCFTVELTRFDRLKDTYSLDIRRRKGNLMRYKGIYDTIRERAELNCHLSESSSCFPLGPARAANSSLPLERGIATAMGNRSSNNLYIHGEHADLCAPHSPPGEQILRSQRSFINSANKSE